MKRAKEKQRTNKNQKGITLIALVVTIVILLILAGITITTLFGENGLITTAKLADQKTQEGAQNDLDAIDEYNRQLSELINETGETGSGEEKTPVDQTSHIGYYADIDDDGTVDGIIYADLAVGGSGTWSSTNNSTFSYTTSSNLKNYAISTKTYGEETKAGTYTAKGFGTKSVVVPNGETGEDRFYVMALKDFSDGTNTTFCWYDAAYDDDGMKDYAEYTSTAFGKGKKNTEDMITKWNDNGYGTRNAGSKPDIWGVIQSKVNEGWFVPSKDEWSAFAYALAITKDNYKTFGLSYYYWSSSQSNAGYAWRAGFNTGYMNIIGVGSSGYMRLSETF